MFVEPSLPLRRCDINLIGNSAPLLPNEPISIPEGAFSAMLINLVCMAYGAIAYYLRARQLLSVSGVVSHERRREIVHFVTPNLPGVIFYGFLGEISLFLVTFWSRRGGG
jgi:hypothetical protein